MFRIFLTLTIVLLFHVTSVFAAPTSFYPIKPWASSSDTSCTLQTEYNNGFIIQLNANDDKSMTLSLNIRQDAFDNGAPYQVAITSDTMSFAQTTATAEDRQTVLIPVSYGEKLLNTISVQSPLDVSIESNTFRFETPKSNDALNMFRKCLNTKASKTSPVFVADTNQTQTYKNLGDDKSGLSHLGIMPDTPVNVHREAYTATADFTDDMTALERENMALREELAMTLRESRKEDISIKGNNWNLERATMMYNESERQVQILGQKLKRQELKCQADIRELEAMLFDPRVTNEQQMAKLADLETKLANAQEELQLQRMRYDERIRILESRIAQ